MGLLSYLFWLEVLLLFSAGVCYFSGRWTSRERPNDLYRTFQAFWHVVLSKRVGQFEVPDVAMQWRTVELAVKELEATGAETGDDDALMLSGWSTEPPALPGEAAGGPGASPAPAPIIDEAVTVTIHVAAQPGPPRLLARSGEVLNVQLSAPPDHGVSNRELTGLLCERLTIRPYQIHLVSGHYRQVKTLRIAGLSRAALEQRLPGNGETTGRSSS